MTRALVCKDCGDFPDAPILLDALWLSIAKKKDFLCFDCLEKRLGRELGLMDLKKCPFNTALIKMLQRKTVLVPTESGTLELAAEQLLAARVSTNFQSWCSTLMVVISFHDNGLPGHLKIEAKDGWASISIREIPPDVDDGDLLTRAKRHTESIANARQCRDVAEIEDLD